MEQAYLDNAATTPLHPKVITAMTASLSHYGNPSSLHSLGIEATKEIDGARENLARLLGVLRDNIVFTSGGTEANNLAIRGYLSHARRQGRIVTSTIEHPSVLEIFNELENSGWEVVRLPVDKQGKVVLAALTEVLAEPVELVSIMAVNNETGTIQPLAEAVSIVRALQPRACFHSDGVQGVGKIPLRPTSIGLDLLSLSAHKIFGPKGAGALYVRKPELLAPLFKGGGQENGLRSGTENVLAITGFGQAAQIVSESFATFQNQVSKLNKQFRTGLQELSCQVISPEDAVANILAVVFPGFKGEVLLQALSAYRVFVSTGAACSSKKGEFGRIAQAMGLDKEAADSMLRFSFSPFNTEKELDYALRKLKEVLADLDYVRGRKGK